MLETNSIDVRKFATNEIRTSLSNFSQQNKLKISDLSSETLNHLKSGLWERVSCEENRPLRLFISETIGEVGYALLERKIWMKLIDSLWYLFEQSSSRVQECAFIILRVLLHYSHSSFSKLITDIHLLLFNGLLQPITYIQIAAIKTLGEVLGQFKKKECKIFRELQIYFQEAVRSIILVWKEKRDILVEEEQVLDVLNVVQEICENEPSFFKDNFNDFYSFIIQLIQDCSGFENAQRVLIEALLSFVQYFPELLQEQTEKIENILHLILFQMVEVSKEISEEWTHPQKEFVEDSYNEQRRDAILFGQNALKSYIPSLEKNIVLHLLFKSIHKMFDEEKIKHDWRYSYAAMMALSQVGEFVQNIADLSPLLKMSFEYSNHHLNPLIRFAFCECVGQIAEDMAPLFQDAYAIDLLPNLIEMLKDSVPRVRAHSAVALSNFLDTTKYDALSSYLPTIIESLFRLIDLGDLLEKEAALTAITSLVSSSSVAFEGHLKYIVEKLFQHLEIALNQPSLKEYIGNILECLSILSQMQKRSAFLPYLDPFLQFIGRISEKAKSQHDFQNKYIFDAWDRLTHNYSDELSNQLTSFMPLLTELTNEVLCQQRESLDTDEISSAIQMISTLSTTFKTQLCTYTDFMYEGVSRLCSNRNESIRESACRSIPLLLGCASNDGERVKSLLRESIKQLREAMALEYESSLIIVQLQCMSRCISEGGEFMSEMEFEFLCNQLMGILQSSEQRKIRVKLQFEDEEIEEEERLVLPIEYKREEQVHLQIAHVLGSIYKSHPSKGLGFSAWTYSNIIPRAFNDLSQTLLVQFGMVLLQDIVRHIGFIRFHQKWEEILNVFSSQLQSPSLLLRTEALRGISYIVTSTPSLALTGSLVPITDTCLQIISSISGISIEHETNSVVKLPKQCGELSSKKRRGYESLKEYAIDILGKVLKLHGSLLGDDYLLTQLWMTCLPIRIEMQIADEQHQIFLQYLILQIEEIAKQSEDDLLHKFTLLADFYHPNICSPFMRPILDRFLLEFLDNTRIAQVFRQLYPKMPNDSQQILKNAFIHLNPNIESPAQLP